MMEAPREDYQAEAVDTGPQKSASQTIGLIALGPGRFRVMSEHEHRLEWEREYRSHP